MKRIASTLSFCIACVLAHAASADSELVYIGTRGPVAAEPSQQDAVNGIYALRLDTETGDLQSLGLQTEGERVMWLVSHPSLPVLYAATGSASNSSAESTIQSFAIDRTSGKLTQRSNVTSGGSGATYLVPDPRSAAMLVAHFGSGSITVLPMLADGQLQGVVSNQKQQGTGPHRRQNAPHAHGIAVAPSGNCVLVTDFGADRLFSYDFDDQTRALSPAQPPFVSIPAGSGPRHVLFDRKGKFVYLSTELSAEIRQYRWERCSTEPELVTSQSLYAGNHADGEKSAGGMVMSADGKFLYVSLRGDQDSVVVYTVNKRSGALKEIQRIPVNGKSPWSIGLDPGGRWMVVTNEASNSVTLLGVDRKTGRLNATDESVSIPKPVSLAFDRS